MFIESTKDWNAEGEGHQNTSGETSESQMSSSSVSPQSSTTMEEDIRRERYPRILNLNLEKYKGIMRRIAKGKRNTRRPLQPTTKSGLLDISRTEVALAVQYLTKAEARDQICRAIQYGSKFLTNGEARTTQNVDKPRNINSDFSPELYLVGYGEGERLMPRQKMFKELDGKLKGIYMQKGGRQPIGMVLPMAKAGGFTFVSDMIHAKGTEPTENDPPTSESKLVSEKIAFIRAVCSNKEEKGRLTKQ
ncbi:peroxisomal membrane protein 11D-like protein [Tanacetum coccineum]